MGSRVAICPPRRGNRKGVVEKANRTAAQRWWRNLSDDVSIAEAQARLDTFCARVGDARVKTIGQTKATVAVHAERERLSPLATRAAADALRHHPAVGCGAPAEVIEAWYQVYATLPYGPDGGLRLFVGMLADEPVATAYVHLVEDAAIVHYVVTLPEFRRRGIGAVMTEFAVREARAAGCRVAVLTASPLGAGLYRQLGFRETGLASNYLWSPEWKARPAQSAREGGSGATC
jgi:ribosomal protein S18 acetylase RimI-like enzyme